MYRDDLDDQRFSISRTIVPGQFETVPEECAIIVHYQILVDVFDSNYTTVAKRTRDKEIKITFTGMERNSDLEEVVSSLIGQTELLPESKANELMSCLLQLQSACDGSYMPSRSTSADKSGQPKKQVSKTIRSEAAPQLAITLSKAEVDNILHESLQKIHWGKDEECIQTLQSLVEIAQYDRNLTLIIQHEPLMNTLCNSLRKYSSSSLIACTKILQIFEKMSYFRNFHDGLARFKIGLMTLNLLLAQIHIASVVGQTMSKEDQIQYIKTQNILLRYCTSLLFNLSDSPKTMRKMVEKGVITGLTAILKRRDPVLLTSALKFIRKLASISTNWGEIPYDEVLPVMSSHIFKHVPTGADARNSTMIPVYKEALDLLFLFGTHPETIEDFKEANVFESVCNLCGLTPLREPLLNLFYQISQQKGSDELFKQDAIFAMLIEAATQNTPERLIALVVLMKLTIDPVVSQKISSSPVFTPANVKSMFVQATTAQSEESSILLKLIRNVADNQPQLISGFDEAIVTACEKNRRNMDALCDILAVSARCEMDSPRSKFFASQDSFMSLMGSLLKDPRAPPQLQLEVVMFVSSIALFSTPAKVLEKIGMVEGVVAVFLASPDDLDVQTQCLFAFYRFIIHKETRKALLDHPEIVDVVIKHSASKNQVLAEMAGNVLDSLTTFDKSWAEKIKLPRFMEFNREWLVKMGTK